MAIKYQGGRKIKYQGGRKTAGRKRSGAENFSQRYTQGTYPLAPLRYLLLPFHGSKQTTLRLYARIMGPSEMGNDFNSTLYTETFVAMKDDHLNTMKGFVSDFKINSPFFAPDL